jgi:hypothetical protein
MESYLDCLRAFVRVLCEQWAVVLLIGSLLFLRWFRGATSSQPGRKPSFARR